jgi:predicted RNase H-related nuclease YkuK (DUF458 family)
MADMGLTSGCSFKNLCMEEKLFFFRFRSNESFELKEYLKVYMAENQDVEILIGSDSQNYENHTIFATVVALYKKGKGAHLLYRKWKTPRKKSISERLLEEVWEAVNAAEYIRLEGFPKPTWIDIDLNPDARFKSNEVFRQAVGLVEGMGYRVRYKNMGPMITYAADHLIKT